MTGGKHQRRVIVFEDDAAQKLLLLDLFTDEGYAVDACPTIQDVYVAITKYPQAVVVADSWSSIAHEHLAEPQRREIEDLGSRAPLILTTARTWGRYIAPGQLGKVAVLPKPFDLNDLLEHVRVMGERRDELSTAGCLSSP
jgi:DNA-binding NtrC family response regulator